jgi:hypothetical protein
MAEVKASAGAAPSKAAAAPKTAPKRSRASGSSKAGPPSSLKTGEGSPTGASAGGNTDFEGRRGSASASKGQAYDVQCHTDEKGLFVLRQTAESGDEAAQKALATEGYKGMSVRGVTPASDPDPNSLGGERDASIMIANAENGGDAGRDLLGTEANREATEKLGKADIEDMGE